MVVTSIFYDDDVVDAISDEVEFLLQFVHSVVRQCCSCRGVYSVLVKIGIHTFAIGALLGLRNYICRATVDASD